MKNEHGDLHLGLPEIIALLMVFDICRIPRRNVVILKCGLVLFKSDGVDPDNVIRARRLIEEALIQLATEIK